tara:strand:+ start:6368 stop:6565 length:198 start_codon:yes stop_codon:yes gene_type:complete
MATDKELFLFFGIKTFLRLPLCAKRLARQSIIDSLASASACIMVPYSSGQMAAIKHTHAPVVVQI